MLGAKLKVKASKSSVIASNSTMIASKSAVIASSSIVTATHAKLYTRMYKVHELAALPADRMFVSWNNTRGESRAYYNRLQHLTRSAN